MNVEFNSTKRGENMTDKKLFEITLLKKSKTKQNIADLLGLSLQTVYNKINNVVDFKTGEISKICEFLKLSNRERDLIFFAHNVE